MTRVARPLIALLSLALGLACAVDKPPEVVAAEDRIPEVIDFALHVRPILSDRCYKCHGPDANQRKAGLRFDTEDGSYAELPESPGDFPIVPGSLRRSQLYLRVSSTDPAVRMPPPESKLSLEPEEIAVLTRWIEQGAEWKPHWAFSPAERPETPRVTRPGWDDNPIDRFVLARLEREGLEPSPEADRETLLRRLSFDLTGLPPTIEEIDAFLDGRSDGAYDTVVDRLLASEHYGERMAVEWLDLARYADTDGYQADFDRDMSPWRDWVIGAFNDNMPFDQFVTWQVAGDLLPDASREQILASGFNRLHPHNGEGGIVEEEFRVEYAADRTQTFATAFMGLTMECARCHDHKFDPISQREYYQLYSFFNNVDEAGQTSFNNFGHEKQSLSVDHYRMNPPTMLLPDASTQSRLDRLSERIGAIALELDTIATRRREESLSGWLEERADTFLQTLRPRGLVAHYPLESIRIDRIPNRVPGGPEGQVFDPVLGRLAERLPESVDGRAGQGLRLNGDDALFFPGVGRFRRGQPFSLAIWARVPGDLEKGVIIHRNIGGALYNFRGYHLAVDGGRVEAVVAHKFPYNSIHVASKVLLPTRKWIHLAMTYDGSSRASGLRLYLDGQPLELDVHRDRLYREILHNARARSGPGIKVGGRQRSKGFTGGSVDELMVFDRGLSAPEIAVLAGDERFGALLKRPVANWTADEKDSFLQLYLERHDGDWQRLQDRLKALRLERNDLMETVPEVMVMDESAPRQAYVLIRGAYDARAEPVEPGTPARIMPGSARWSSDRRGLAQWLTHPDHPLFARVAVNRLWQQLFGSGLVKTAEDFGQQGELPSHPGLLDWLARELMESGWDVKAMQKLIVTSATYRQSSHTDSETRERDPENRLLTRGASSRLTAEMLRDQALLASGLLVETIGGPSVKPYQPDGLWVINPFSSEYLQDEGEKLYRRSLYTFWKRSVPPPTMDMFDAPGRSRCEVRRQRTSTPVQALALMNDPQFVEASRVAAERVLRQAGEDPGDRIIHAMRLFTGRRPRPEELDVLLELYEGRRRGFQGEPSRARQLLGSGDFPRDDALDPVEVASLDVVVGTIMNYDASVMKR